LTEPHSKLCVIFLNIPPHKQEGRGSEQKAPRTLPFPEAGAAWNDLARQHCLLPESDLFWVHEVGGGGGGRGGAGGCSNNNIL
jgi:hypothetical protein